MCSSDLILGMCVCVRESETVGKVRVCVCLCVSRVCACVKGCVCVFEDFLGLVPSSTKYILLYFSNLSAQITSYRAQPDTH